MTPDSPEAAAISQPSPAALALSGRWTAREMGGLKNRLDAVHIAASTLITVDGSPIAALDTAGAWTLHKLLQRLRDHGASVSLLGLSAPSASLLDVVRQQLAEQLSKPAATAGPPPTMLERMGRRTAGTIEHAVAMLTFVSETAAALVHCVAHPAHLRWRPVLFNIRTAGLDALPIVGLLSFLLGVVVAYQGADQLRQYGANIFIADLVGVSILREFAPLIAAIIVAGRSGAAYAAQIGTVVVTEEFDAMRTLGIVPQE